MRRFPHFPSHRSKDSCFTVRSKLGLCCSGFALNTPAARSAALPSAFAFHRFRPALVSPPAFLGLDAFRKPPPLPLVPAALGTHGAVPVAASALVRVRVRVRVSVH